MKYFYFEILMGRTRQNKQEKENTKNLNRGQK